MTLKRNTEGTYVYRFRNNKVKKAFKQLAMDNDITLQDLITNALKVKYKAKL